jgi:hypothetical protein
MKANKTFNSSAQLEPESLDKQTLQSFAVDIDPFPEPSILNLNDWIAFCLYKVPGKPDIPTPEIFAMMSAEEKKASGFPRRSYNASYGPVLHKSFTLIYDDLLMLAHAGLQSGYGVRNGAVCTGPGTVGKSTLVQHVGKDYDLRLRAAVRANYGGDGFLMPRSTWRFAPVIYITLKGGSSLKGIYLKLARFLLVPKYDKMTIDQLNIAIVEHAKNMGVSLIIIDDIHYLHRRSEGVNVTNNDLKSLMSEIAATLIFAGINCDAAGLFDEYFDGKLSSTQTGTSGPGSQTNHRFSRFELKPFAHENGKCEEVEEILKAYDKNLVLVNHKRKDLRNLQNYILMRTGGYVGAIRQLIRLGAAKAISDGTERITEELLETIKLNNAADQQYRQLLAMQASQTQ